MVKEKRKTKAARKTDVVKAPADADVVETADMRFKDTVPLDKFRALTIGVAGLGAVGRNVAIMLGTMGHQRLYGVDPDKIELKNVGTQGWAPADIGQYKCDVINRDIGERSCFHPEEGRYENQSYLSGIDVHFGCVDTMAARSAIFRRVLRVKRKNLQGLYLDSRMRSRIIRLVTVDLASAEDVEYYMDSMFPDSEADEGLCTDRMTIYGAYIAAGLMVSQLVNKLRGMPLKRDFIVDTSVMQLNEITGKTGQ